MDRLYQNRADSRAVGAIDIRKNLISHKQCVFLITTGAFGIGTVVAFLLIIGFIYLLFRPYKESTTLKVDTKKVA